MPAWKPFVTIIDGQNQLGITVISLHGKVSNKSWILGKIYKATLLKFDVEKKNPKQLFVRQFENKSYGRRNVLESYLSWD